MIAFIDYYREVHGVEPNRKVSPIVDLPCPCRETRRSEEALHASQAGPGAETAESPALAARFDVYGVRKVWVQLSAKSSTLPSAPWS